MTFGTGGTEVHATTGSDTYFFNDSANDTIVYTAAVQSDGGSPSTDTINSFDVAADKIDISAIADAGWTYTWDDGSDVLKIYLDNNSTPDMVINLTGVNGTHDDLIGIFA
jgi:hypothetical protein